MGLWGSGPKPEKDKKVSGCWPAQARGVGFSGLGFRGLGVLGFRGLGFKVPNTDCSSWALMGDPPSQEV